jgi:hypothetical protein
MSLKFSLRFFFFWMFYSYTFNIYAYYLFALNFLCIVRSEKKLIFVYIFIARLLEKSFSIKVSFLLVENQFSIGVWFYFWILDSILKIYVATFTSIPNCFNYRNFIINPKIMW